MDWREILTSILHVNTGVLLVTQIGLMACCTHPDAVGYIQQNPGPICFIRKTFASLLGTAVIFGMLKICVDLKPTPFESF
jgi:hypothetical protein